MYVLKIANASRNHASPLLMSAGVSLSAETMLVVPSNVTKVPSPSQKPP